MLSIEWSGRNSMEMMGRRWWKEGTRLPSQAITCHSVLPSYLSASQISPLSFLIPPSLLLLLIFLVPDVQLLLCLTVCSPTDFSLQVSSVHRIFQVKTLEWGAISHSRGSSWPRDQIWSPHVSCIGRQILCH